MKTNPRLTDMVKYCGCSLVVLGEWQASPGAESAAAQPPPGVAARRQTANLWLRMSSAGPGRAPQPTLRSLHCCGNPFQTAPHVVFCAPPDPTRMQYLVPTLRSATGTARPASPAKVRPKSPPTPEQHPGKPRRVPVAFGAKNRTRDEAKLPPPSTNAPPQDGGGVSVRPLPSAGLSELEHCLRQVNSSAHVLVYLLAALRQPTRRLPDMSPPVTGCRSTDPAEVLQEVQGVGTWQFAVMAGAECAAAAAGEVATHPTHQPRHNCCLRGAAAVVLAWLYVLRLLVGGVLAVVNAQVPTWLPCCAGRSLRHVSATSAQLDRLGTQLLVWPGVIQASRTMNSHWRLARHRVQHHVAAWGSVSLTVLDVAVGIITGVMLFTAVSQPASGLLATVHYVGRLLHMDVLRSNIRWLSLVPAGLKLNAPLASQLSHVVLELLSAWNSITTFLTPLEPMIAVVVACSGIGGCSLMLAVCSDVLGIITLHVRLLYMAFATAWNTLLRIAYSLFLLFRGKKYNTLRLRVDSLQSDTAQLLMGVLLFSVVALLPTLGVYYAFFVIVWGLVLALQGFLWCAIALLTRFPLYGLIVRALDPGCIPGGIRVRLCGPDGQDCDLSKLGAGSAATPAGGVPSDSPATPPSNPHATYIWLHSHGAPPSVLLASYTDTLSAVVGKHYAPARVLRGALTGGGIPLAPQATFDRLRDSTPASRHLSIPSPAHFIRALQELFELVRSEDDGGGVVPLQLAGRRQASGADCDTPDSEGSPAPTTSGQDTHAKVE